MTRTQEQQKKIEEAVKAATINQKKAFIFAFGWMLRKRYKFMKYPEAYNAAKKFIGTRSLVFGIPPWPKKFERGPLQTQMRMFYQLMEQSLENDDWRIDGLINNLIIWPSSYYHKHVDLKTADAVWFDTVLEQPIKSPSVPYSSDSVALAVKLFETEKFDQPEHWLLCDSLEDSGHDFEMDHLRTGIHTPACPVLRKIAGIK